MRFCRQKASSDLSKMDPLLHSLRAISHGKSVLLVLDDVWNEDHEEWHRLKTALDLVWYCDRKQTHVNYI
uniref:Disease resistance protein RGA3 n=1 Tax=Nelumbo nucifera TaxID=4432 RepID=A0A822XZZ8_NELNU|nr:TPA_asm: hypothetical protein HUJ06_026040 [Nelumbo nucifera]